MSRRLISVVLVAVGCAPSGEPGVSLTATPRGIDNNGAATTLKATAVDSAGRPGVGAIKFAAAAGSLTNAETVTLSSAGTAETSFTCDVGADERCTGQIRVVAQWQTASGSVGAELRISLNPVATPTPDGGPNPVGLNRGDPKRIYLYGTIQRSATHGDVFADFRDLAHPIISFPSYTDDDLVLIGFDGKVLYLRTFDTKLYALVGDSFERPMTNGYAGLPMNPLANDEVFATPPCADVGRMWARPDAPGVLYMCRSDSQVYESGVHLPQFDQRLIALGYQGSALVEGPAAYPIVIAPDGSEHLVIANIDVGFWRAIRATPTGFLFPQGMTRDVCELWQVTFDGAATRLGDFAAVPSGIDPAFCIGRLDPEGNLWSIANGTGNVSDGVVIKRVLQPGSSVVVYDSRTAPAPNFMKYPPDVYAVPTSTLRDGLITGP